MKLSAYLLCIQDIKEEDSRKVSIDSVYV